MKLGMFAGLRGPQVSGQMLRDIDHRVPCGHHHQGPVRYRHLPGSATKSAWEEFEACGVPWERRGARTDEYMDLMRVLWTEHESSFEGEFYNLPSCHMYPKPIQNPFPIHIGGHSPAAMRRTAKYGQGWFGFGITPEQTEGLLATLDKALEEVGRARDEIQITVCPPRKLTEELLEGYAAASVDQLLAGYYRQNHETLPQWFDEIEPFVTTLQTEEGS